MIDRTEFRDAVHLIREDIRAVQTRLDVLNGRTRTNELEIVRLQERQKSRARRSAAWAGSLGVLLTALAEGIHWLVTK